MAKHTNTVAAAPHQHVTEELQGESVQQRFPYILLATQSYGIHAKKSYSPSYAKQL